MRWLLSILLFACCAGAQMPPTEFFVESPGDGKGLAARTLGLCFNPSPSPDLAGYNVYSGTNEGAYVSELSVGLTNFVWAQDWPQFTNYFAAAAVNSSGIQSAMSAPTSHSGWAADFKIALQVSTNGVVYTNVICVDLAAIRAPAYFRSAVNAGAGIVEMQMASSLSFAGAASIYTADVDGFPPDAGFDAVPMTKIVNVP
jgi:hypothetical protein